MPLKILVYITYLMLPQKSRKENQAEVICQSNYSNFRVWLFLMGNSNILNSYSVKIFNGVISLRSDMPFLMTGQ